MISLDQLVRFPVFELPTFGATEHLVPEAERYFSEHRDEFESA